MEGPDARGEAMVTERLPSLLPCRPHVRPRMHPILRMPYPSSVLDRLPELMKWWMDYELELSLKGFLWTEIRRIELGLREIDNIRFRIGFESEDTKTFVEVRKQWLKVLPLLIEDVRRDSKRSLVSRFKKQPRSTLGHFRLIGKPRTTRPRCAPFALANVSRESLLLSAPSLELPRRRRTHPGVRPTLSTETPWMQRTAKDAD